MKKWKNHLVNIKKILNDNLIKEAYKNFKTDKFPLHWRIFYTLNKYKLSTLIYLMLKSINSLRKYA